MNVGQTRRRPMRRPPGAGTVPFKFFSVQPGVIGPPGFLPPNFKAQPTRQFRGLGDAYPSEVGTPGNAVWPYDETEVWGAGGPPGGGLAPAPPDANIPAVGPATAPPWSNPDTFSSVPI